MKLHYSQTMREYDFCSYGVSVPYEITLLSNSFIVCLTILFVSVPYEITLLSNSDNALLLKAAVSVPYEITLLSNLK